jgi:hypothetical protein
MLIHAAAASEGGGVDLVTIVGWGIGLLGGAGVLLYLVGLLRPFKVVDATWRRTAQGVEFSCFLRNRSVYIDRTVTALALVEQPASRFERAFGGWRKHWRPATIQLVSPVHDEIRNGTMKISKHDERPVRGLLLDRADQPAEPPPRTRVEAHAGSKRSRSGRIKAGSSPPRGG